MSEKARYHYGTGRRKTAVARVRMYPGKGLFTVNGKQVPDYFGGRSLHYSILESPLRLTNTLGRYDIIVTVRGGGASGQVGAVRHGISRALVRSDDELRPILKRAGFLTRDSRAKERKKVGLKRARKAPQYTKR